MAVEGGTKMDQNWSDAIVQAMMPAYNKEERKHRCGSVKRSTGKCDDQSLTLDLVGRRCAPNLDLVGR